MKKKIDLSGERFGMLTVLRRNGQDRNGRNALWLCICDCGGYTTTSTSHLKSGHSKTCGCIRGKQDACRKTQLKPTHGLSRTRVYRIWAGMKDRCNNPKATKYYLYGGRGIKVCEEWERNVQSFYDWAMANGYQDDLSIDRIDNNKGYEPSNCRWATTTEQNRNRRCVKK